ncbi:MAG: hypothetical protein VX151_03620, partial [Candidatus Thermoplasmatota archaeon]|nr:hypothetical protein [Candidatus Thermoplasmatota archaeon]
LVEADGGWSTTYIVDIAYAEYAPVIQIKDPGGIERDEKITATLSCSVPFDTDDNPEDDSMSTYYKPENVLAVSSNDIGWIVGVAVLILALSWLTGVVQVGKKQQQPQPAQRKPAKETKQQEAAEVTEATSEDEEQDDFHMEVVPSSEAPAVDEEMTAVEAPVVEVFEEEESTPVPEDTTASGRLANLRQELGGEEANEREGSIEDRMKKFFGGNE